MPTRNSPIFSESPYIAAQQCRGILCVSFFLKESHWVHLTPAFPHFEVQVISGGIPSVANQGDDIPLLHFLPGFHQHL